MRYKNGIIDIRHDINIRYDHALQILTHKHTLRTCVINIDISFLNIGNEYTQRTQRL